MLRISSSLLVVLLKVPYSPLNLLLLAFQMPQNVVIFVLFVLTLNAHCVLMILVIPYE